jgi:hypothetical protein
MSFREVVFYESRLMRFTTSAASWILGSMDGSVDSARRIGSMLSSSVL